MSPVVAYVPCLLLSLASPSFDTREAAEIELVRLVGHSPEVYGPAVERFARQPAAMANPESSRRLSRIASIYRRHLAATYVPPGGGWPSCYCYPRRVLWFDFADPESVPPVWMNGVTGEPVSDWDSTLTWWDCELVYADACAGTERMARRLIYNGSAPEDVDSLLLRMLAIEKRH